MKYISKYAQKVARRNSQPSVERHVLRDSVTKQIVGPNWGTEECAKGRAVISDVIRTKPFAFEIGKY